MTEATIVKCCDSPQGNAEQGYAAAVKREGLKTHPSAAKAGVCR